VVAVTGGRVAVWQAGAVRTAPPTDPVLSAFDLGLGRGDGVFESVLVTGATTPHLAAHLTRLRQSAGLLGITHPGDDAVRDAVAAVVAGWPPATEGGCRVLLTRGLGDGTPPTLLALLAAVPPETLRQRPDGVTVISLCLGVPANFRAHAPWLLGGAKTLSYAVNMAAGRHARTAGGDRHPRRHHPGPAVRPRRGRRLADDGHAGDAGGPARRGRRVAAARDPRSRTGHRDRRPGPRGRRAHRARARAAPPVT
jgi:hypothetical protein